MQHSHRGIGDGLVVRYDEQSCGKLCPSCPMRADGHRRCVRGSAAGLEPGGRRHPITLPIGATERTPCTSTPATNGSLNARLDVRLLHGRGRQRRPRDALMAVRVTLRCSVARRVWSQEYAQRRSPEAYQNRRAMFAPENRAAVAGCTICRAPAQLGAACGRKLPASTDSAAEPTSWRIARQIAQSAARGLRQMRLPGRARCLAFGDERAERSVSQGDRADHRLRRE
jgi:hypothetical protein